MFMEKKLDQWARKIRATNELALLVDLWNGKQISFSQNQPEVILRISSPSTLSYLLTPSLFNLGSAYVEGKIDVEGKPEAIIAMGNALAGATLRPIGKYARRIYSSWHTRKNDREAIRYHYDVSNEFYQLWLDPRMVYSCAYFANGDESLEQAQVNKIEHILNKIRLRPDETLLDIGCGWGALVIHAAQKYGAKCVGVTISENQARLARERVEQAGLSNRVEIRLQDYRDVTGRFNKITSVGMFEHVGLKHLPAYFSKIQTLLTDDGMALNHGITTSDADNGASPYGNAEFVDRYIFPQGELPHLGLAIKAMQMGGLETLDVENLRRHYVRTCQLWSDNFEEHAQQVRQAVGEKKYRIWRLYLAGSAYAFRQDWISLYQIVCVKAGRHPDDLPWSRRYLYQ